MAAFAIMRCKKLSSTGNLAASLQHAYRERDTPNADPQRTPSNDHWLAKSTDEAMGKIRNLLPEKRRKDAVLAVEYLLTASPEWWNSASESDQAKFFDQAYKWLADKYGSDRIVTATIHRDETSPHMTAFVVPLTQDGRLSAKEFIGNKTQMTKDQTTFAASVANLGLVRGIEGSRATHQRVKSHYTAIQQAENGLPFITESELKPQKVKGDTFAEKLFGAVETTAGIVNRLNEKIANHVKPIAEKASVSAQNQKLAKDLSDTLTINQKRLKSLQEPLNGLSNDQIELVMKFAREIQASNRKKHLEKTSKRTL
jgi:hypothetical protein